ncbi:MAG: hypothetical protein HY895_19965 [Deltaproteobacteria bacterium]|nr:hypothetical protein [Deltaproteobacteria bacterium]
MTKPESASGPVEMGKSTFETQYTLIRVEKSIEIVAGCGLYHSEAPFCDLSDGFSGTLPICELIAKLIDICTLAAHLEFTSDPFSRQSFLKKIMGFQ